MDRITLTQMTLIEVDLTDIDSEAQGKIIKLWFDLKVGFGTFIGGYSSPTSLKAYFSNDHADQVIAKIQLELDANGY